MLYHSLLFGSGMGVPAIKLPKHTNSSPPFPSLIIQDNMICSSGLAPQDLACYWLTLCTVHTPHLSLLDYFLQPEEREGKEGSW